VASHAPGVAADVGQAVAKDAASDVPQRPSGVVKPLRRTIMSATAAGGTLDGMTVTQLEELQRRVQASLTAAKAKCVVRHKCYEFDGRTLVVTYEGYTGKESHQSIYANKTLERLFQDAWNGIGGGDAKLLGELLIAVADRKQS
jgi:hypothetical protein